MSNKKSQLFSMALVGITVAILIYLFVVISDKKTKFDEEIGEKQFELFRFYNKGESTLFYVDNAARFASYQSLYDLARKSGFSNEHGCGNYSGTKLWNNLSDYCFPDENISFSSILNRNLNEQFERHQGQRIPQDNYDFFIKRKKDNMKITGIATENIFVRSELSVVGGPSITAEKIDEVLEKAGSPAKGTSEAFIYYGEQTNIDPAIALAFFAHESNYGTKGVAAKTNSIGNIRYREGCYDKYTSDVSGDFCVYSTWEDSIKAWFELISGNGYAGTGLDTVEKIIPKYAPQEDNNDEETYINSVREKVGKYRKEELGKSTGNEIAYSVKPSFTADIDYNLDIYGILKKQSKELIAACSNSDNFMECINTEIRSYSNEKVNWRIGGCGNEAENAYYDIFENFYDCQSSMDENCYCEFLPPEELSQNIKINFSKTGDKKTSIELLEPELNVKLREVVDLESPSHILEFFVEEFDLEPNIIRRDLIYESRYKNGRLSETVIESLPKIIYEDSVKLFKSRNELSFVSDEVFSENPDYFGEECYTGRNIRFCIETDDILIAYDKVYDNTVLRNVRIGFALEFPDITPPPKMENVIVEDSMKAENSVTISWDENKAGDVKDYKIYYSTEDFEDVKEEGVVNILNVSNNILITDVAGMMPYDHNKEMNTYYFSVSAIDYTGNENKTVDAVKGIAIDDLRPKEVSETRLEVEGNEATISWNRVKNEDDSEAVDVKYQIHQSKDDYKSLITTLSKTRSSYEFISLETGTYKFGVRAVDEALEGTIVWSDVVTI